MKELGFMFVVFLGFWGMVESSCSEGCELALASYIVSPGSSLSLIAEYLNANLEDIPSYNSHITNPNNLQIGIRVNVPFSCDCIKGDFLGHNFRYQINSDDTYDEISEMIYSNLTTSSLIQWSNSYDPTNLPVGGILNVTVNCSCGNSSVSPDYGLFITFPLRPGNTLDTVAQKMNVSASLLHKYNPDADFGAGTGLVYIPAKDRNGSYHPLPSDLSNGGSPSSGISHGVIIGVAVALVVGLCVLSVCWYLVGIRGKKKKDSLLPAKTESPLPKAGAPRQRGGSPVPGITVHKSVKFPYEELANATNNFSIANKIGEGGFGAVYYGELRGEKAAIKKMDMQATREFLAELKVLTHVHHLNLVRLIGYCVKGSLFLVYEYIENGNLTQHLRGSGKAPVPWSTRVQIALDSARGLEYIHEHTVPVYIHRDIKSANILIDSNFHAKVADFGLAKLSEVGNASIPTPLMGTFGYMPPEYAQFGDVSAKIDVYAFGVVLFELISAKEALVKENRADLHPKSLPSLFEDALSQSDPNSLRKLVDPRLGDDYPLDSVLKMAELARACTQEDPDLRPTMRSAMVELNSLASKTGNWDIIQARPFKPCIW